LPVLARRWVLLVAAIAAAPAAVARADERQAAYVEVLGKGGLGGVGWDLLATRRLGGGIAASFYVLDGQRVLSLSPYLAVYPVRAGRHGWFAHVGPQLVRVATPSPVPEWPGHTDLGVGVEVSSGYEYRHGLLARVYLMASAGEAGIAPWLGASVGWSF
jgi:hypothetical protein